MSYYREQLESWLKTIEVDGDHVLDIGGSQLPIGPRLKYFKPLSYRIFDLPEPHKIQERAHITGDISDPNLTWPQHYDHVFCLEVMEYVTNPVQAVANIARAVREGGTLYISFGFLYPHHNPVGKDMFRYTINAVQMLLKPHFKNGIEIVPRIAKNPNLLRAFYAGDGMRYCKDDTIDDIGYLVKAKK